MIYDDSGWLMMVVTLSGNGLLSAISWHHYYLNGRTANIRSVFTIVTAEIYKSPMTDAQAAS